VAARSRVWSRGRPHRQQTDSRFAIAKVRPRVLTMGDASRIALARRGTTSPAWAVCERALLDDWLSAVQGGQTRSLVLRRYAEIWKTALLGYPLESGVAGAIAAVAGNWKIWRSFALLAWRGTGEGLPGFSQRENRASSVPRRAGAAGRQTSFHTSRRTTSSEPMVRLMT
jgi:hypothetical protein